jgi:hypothetical protein
MRAKKRKLQPKQQSFELIARRKEVAVEEGTQWREHPRSSSTNSNNSNISSRWGVGWEERVAAL